MTIDKSLATDLELWFRNEVFLSAVHMLKTYLLDGDTIERWLGHESFILIHVFIAIWNFRRWSLAEVGHWRHDPERHILLFAFQVYIFVFVVV